MACRVCSTMRRSAASSASPSTARSALAESLLCLGCEQQVAGEPGQGRDLLTAGFRAARGHHGARIPCQQRGGVQDVVDGGDALVERGERGLQGHVIEAFRSIRAAGIEVAGGETARVRWPSEAVPPACSAGRRRGSEDGNGIRSADEAAMGSRPR